MKSTQHCLQIKIALNNQTILYVNLNLEDVLSPENIVISPADI